MEEYKICHNCGAKMEKTLSNKSFHVCGQIIQVEKIESFLCRSCGEEIYSDDAVLRIEKEVYSRG